jgi:thiol-disulfide isomerase/thioredoxin
MVRSRGLAAWLSTAALSVGLAVPGAWGQLPQPGVGYNQGDTPPDWSLTDQHGAPIKPADFRGKSLILVFSAVWCGPCRDAVPVAEALVKRLNSNGEPTAIAEILVQDEFGDPADTIDAKEWADRFGIEGPVLSSSGSRNSPAWAQFYEYGKRLGGYAFPTVILLTPHGRIITGSHGFSDGWIEAILTRHLYGDTRSGIDWLLTSVERSGLGEPLMKSLTVPLQAALKALDERQPGLACAELKSFVDRVATQPATALAATQATRLRDSALLLRSQMGCP